VNLVFKKMTIDNFMSFDKEVFNFEDTPGITLITGINNDIPGSKNGCGKSSLINAFVFALFGKMLNQMTIKNVSNRYVPLRNTEVILEMTVDDIPYCIISGIKGNPKSGYCILHRSTYEQRSDDNNLTKHSVRETRAFIEKNIIQTNFDVFLRSFVLTSDQFYNFFKMSKQEKRVFIENIFDLKIFGEMYRTIHKEKLDNDRVLQTLDALVASQANDIKSMEEKNSSGEKTVKTEIATIEKQIKELKTRIKTNKALCEKHDVVKLRGTLDTLGKTASKIRHRRSKLESEIAGKKTLVNHLKTQYQEKIDYVKTYIDTYNDLSEHSKPIVSEKLGLQSVKDSAKEIAVTVKREIGLIKSMTTELESCVVPVKLTESISKIEKAINKLDNISRNIKQDTKDVTRNNNSIEKLKSNTSVIKELLINKQAEYEEHSEKLTESVEFKNILTFIENVIGEENIRRLVVSDLIKLLNNQIQTYLISMGADFTCMFDKDLNYTFLTKNGETEYDSFSSGEKMRMSIATSFAFRDFIVNRSGINSNVLILDEYIDANLDDLAVGEIFKILREFNILYNQNIFVVSHREAVKLNTFDSVYSVDKTDGISKINKQSGE
jgi:DNA repair exonuclease SbcCD ATPase subunit